MKIGGAGWVERISTAFAVIGILAFVAMILILRNTRAGIESTPRTAAEQALLLTSGDCALAPNDSLLGKVTGRLQPGFSQPHGGYALASIDHDRVFEVGVGDVRLVPCRSLRR
jgi:hypothetical protein